MEKQFSFESAKNQEGGDYHSRILRIINDVEERVRYVAPDSLLHTELHTKKPIDAHKEVAEFEQVRKDVCESFNVPQDSEHIFIYDRSAVPGAKEQRALRAFYVLVDAVKKEAYYGEGRTDHITLLNKLIGLMKSQDPAVDFESVIEKINEEPPRVLIFKGFLSIKEFKELSDSSRKALESPLFDADGNKIETAEDWFLTGHNLEGALPSSPKN